MRNPFCFGLTTNTNFSAYLFIVTTPGKLTGWIGLPTKSTNSIITALKSWLTQTELLGQTQSVRFIRTDARTAFTCAKFIAECPNLGLNLKAAAPKHQEMNGIMHIPMLSTIVDVCPAKNVTDINGIPTTPYQFSYHCKPSLANFLVFGCPTFFKCYKPTIHNKIITNKQQLQRVSRGIFL